MIFHDWSLWPKAGGKITLTLTGTGEPYENYFGCSVVIDGTEYYTAQTLEVDAGTEVLCHCAGMRGGEIYLNGSLISAGEDVTYTANKNATIEFDTSGASYYLRITEI